MVRAATVTSSELRSSVFCTPRFWELCVAALSRSRLNAKGRPRDVYASTHAVLSCGAARAGLVLADTITVIVPCPRHPRQGQGALGARGYREVGWWSGGAPGVIFIG